MNEFISRIKNKLDHYLLNILEKLDFGDIKKFENSFDEDELQCIQHSIKAINLHLQNGTKPDFSEKIKLKNGKEVVVKDIIFNMPKEKLDMFKTFYNHVVDDNFKNNKKIYERFHI